MVLDHVEHLLRVGVVAKVLLVVGEEHLAAGAVEHERAAQLTADRVWSDVSGVPCVVLCVVCAVCGAWRVDTYRPSPWKLPSLPRDFASDAAFHTDGRSSEKIDARVVCA